MEGVNLLNLPLELFNLIIENGFPQTLILYRVCKTSQGLLASLYKDLIHSLKMGEDILEFLFKQKKFEHIKKTLQYKIQKIPQNKIFFELDFLRYSEFAWKLGLPCVQYLWNHIPECIYTTHERYVRKKNKGKKYFMYNKPSWLKDIPIGPWWYSYKLTYVYDYIHPIDKILSVKKYLYKLIPANILACCVNSPDEIDDDLLAWLILRLKENLNTEEFQSVLSRAFQRAVVGFSFNIASKLYSHVKPTTELIQRTLKYSYEDCTNQEIISDLDLFWKNIGISQEFINSIKNNK